MKESLIFTLLASWACCGCPFTWSYFRPLTTSARLANSDATTVASLLASDDDPFNFDLTALMMKINEEDDMRNIVGFTLSSLLDDIKQPEAPLVDQIISSEPSEVSSFGNDLGQSIVAQTSHRQLEEDDDSSKTGSFSMSADDREEGSHANALTNHDNTEETSDNSSDIPEHISDEGSTELASNLAGDTPTSPSPAISTGPGVFRTDENFVALRRLGYARQEIVALKESVRAMLVEQEVERPAGPLPSAWIKRNGRVGQATSVKAGVSKPTTKVNAGYKAKASSSESNTVQTSSKSTVSRIAQDFRLDDPDPRAIGSDVRTAKWRGIPVIDAEDDDADNRSGRLSSTASVYDQERFLLDPSMDESTQSNGALTIWPNKEEFKDLLLQESRLRVDIMGDWLVPSLRKENNWRLQLYESWLTFLQEGFDASDRFDIVDENFQGDEAQEDTSEVDQEIRRRRKRAVSSSYSAQKVVRSETNGDMTSDERTTPASTAKDQPDGSARQFTKGKKAKKVTNSGGRARAYENMVGRSSSEALSWLEANIDDSDDDEMLHDNDPQSDNPLLMNKEVWFTDVEDDGDKEVAEDDVIRFVEKHFQPSSRVPSNFEAKEKKSAAESVREMKQKIEEVAVRLDHDEIEERERRKQRWIERQGQQRSTAVKTTSSKNTNAERVANLLRNVREDNDQF